MLGDRQGRGAKSVFPSAGHVRGAPRCPVPLGTSIPRGREGVLRARVLLSLRSGSQPENRTR